MRLGKPLGSLIRGRRFDLDARMAESMSIGVWYPANYFIRDHLSNQTLGRIAWKLEDDL